eukprot:766710-Hanusia_phi.AAC.14
MIEQTMRKKGQVDSCEGVIDIWSCFQSEHAGGSLEAKGSNPSILTLLVCECEADSTSQAGKSIEAHINERIRSSEAKYFMEEDNYKLHRNRDPSQVSVQKMEQTLPKQSPEDEGTKIELDAINRFVEDQSSDVEITVEKIQNVKSAKDSQLLLEELRRVATDRLDKLEKSAGGNVLMKRHINAQKERILEKIAVSEAKFKDLNQAARELNVDPGIHSRKFQETEMIKMNYTTWLLYLLGGSTLICGTVASSLLFTAHRDAEFARKLRKAMPFTTGLLDVHACRKAAQSFEDSRTSEIKGQAPNMKLFAAGLIRQYCTNLICGIWSSGTNAVTVWKGKKRIGELSFVFMCPAFTSHPWNQSGFYLLRVSIASEYLS